MSLRAASTSSLVKFFSSSEFILDVIDGEIVSKIGYVVGGV